MNLENQAAYWDGVAASKTFTHPVDRDLLLQMVTTASCIVDFGCGYGRVVRELNEAGYEYVKGFDTSAKLIDRGRNDGVLNIYHIDTFDDLPVEDNSVDLILVFAVLTCIPENGAQEKLIDLLQSKLKPGGSIYVSDYYLQEDTAEVTSYSYLNDDKENYGVFHLPEGATFRHHTRQWIAHLFAKWKTVEERNIEVLTMNGHKAQAFQLIARK